MSNNGNGKKDIISARYLVNTTHGSPSSTPHTRNSKIVLSSAKTTFRPPQQQPLARYSPPPFARIKCVDDIGSSDDNKKNKLTMSRPKSKVTRCKNFDLKEERTASPRQGISEIAQLRNELRNMQSECNRLRKEHDTAIKNLVNEHKTTIAILTKKHEATIKHMKYYKMMAESNTNLMPSIDETHPGTFGRSYCYNTPRQHLDPPVKTTGEIIPPVESFESSWINHQQHVHRLHQMIMEEEAKVHDEKQIVVYVVAEKKGTNHNDPLTDFIISDSLNLKKCPVSPIASVDSSWKSLPNVRSLPKVHDGPLATLTGDAKKCFIVPPLHSGIRAMKPKYLANHHHHHHHCMKSTESIISGLTMPTSLLHLARTTRSPAAIYAEKTLESNLLRLLDKEEQE